MSKILGVWGEIPEANQEWHEQTQIPEVTKRLGARAFHFEAGQNMFPDEVKQKATSYTLYELPESTEPNSLAAQSLLLPGSSRDVPKDVLLEARYYTCQWERKAKEYSGDYADTGCLTMGIFKPTKETHDAFFEWWYGECVPFIVQRSPDFLRARLWKLDEGADLRHGTVRKRDSEDLLPYVMAYEFRSDDIPWDVAVELARSKSWYYFMEQNLQYKYGLYHLKRIYTKTGEVEAEFDNDVYSNEEEVRNNQLQWPKIT